MGTNTMDEILADVLLVTLRLEQYLKYQRVQIEQLKSEKKEMGDVIVQLKKLIIEQSPELVRQLELFKI
ncbi:MAG: hypothetical protein BHV78_04610 [Bacteroides sp. CAG:1060_57_27]|nr:MAG: hypothetical protein BHV78_04610 [Bacteroides sp. CAG:1060_57_27]